MIYIFVGDSPSIKHNLQLISLSCVSFSVFILLIWSFSDCRNNDCNGYGLWSPEFPQLTHQWQKIFASVELFLHFLLLVITEIMAWVWFWGDRWQRKAKQLSSHRIRMEPTVWMSCKSSMNRITIHRHHHHSLACNHHHHHHSPACNTTGYPDLWLFFLLLTFEQNLFLVGNPLFTKMYVLLLI